MLKFKKEDAGLYFSLVLVGAGAGLLIGAFAASRRSKRQVEEFDDLEMPIEVGEDSPVQPYLDLEEQTIEFRADLDEEWLEAWQPTQLQLEMYRTGMATRERLEMLIAEKRYAEEREPYNYAARYGKKDELGDVVEDGAFDAEVIAKEDATERIREALEAGDLGVLDDIDDRYNVRFSNPLDAPLNKELSYDVEDGHLLFLSSRGNLLRVSDVKAYISENTWFAVSTLLTRGQTPIYVEDVNNEQIYKFIRMGELGEDEFPDTDASGNS